jgi:heme A synthase
MATSGSDRRFAAYAWFVLAVTVVVILSGDIVQATKSGAGCGESWPRCDGSLIPSIGDAATAIEFSHRMLTTVLGLGFAGLGLWAFLRYRPQRPHRVWSATLWAGAFFVVEVLIGAALVIFGWVEEDASIGRLVADGVHVVNTFLLLGAVALVAAFASGWRRPRLRSGDRRLIAAGMVTVIVIAITGAVNSLADFLFESDEVSAAVRADLLETTGWLREIRVVHPAVAIVGGIGILSLVTYLSQGAPRAAVRLGYAVRGLVGLLFVAGLANVALQTPLETQLVHLLLADALWIAFLLYALRLGIGPEEERRPAVDRQVRTA